MSRTNDVRRLHSPNAAFIANAQHQWSSHDPLRLDNLTWLQQSTNHVHVSLLNLRSPFITFRILDFAAMTFLQWLLQLNPGCCRRMLKQNRPPKCPLLSMPFPSAHIPDLRIRRWCSKHVMHCNHRDLLKLSCQPATFQQCTPIIRDCWITRRCQVVIQSFIQEWWRQISE
jgi:hypothetical protein